MSVESSIELLRAQDPARSLPVLPVDARDRLRAQIVGTSPRRRPARRRFVVALAIGAAALLFAATGWAIHERFFQTSADVRSDFATVTANIALPPGAVWKTPNLDDQGLYAGTRAAEVLAYLQATCAWFSYWDEAHKAGATARMGSAVAGFVLVRTTMPLHPDGATEDVGGFDKGTLALYDRVIAEQRARNATLTEQYLRANCRN
jgi:hypothetical protein